MIIFWLIVAIAVFAIDVLTSNFCFVLLSIGGIAAAIASALGVSVIVQVIIFAVVGIISLAVGYPILKEKFKKTYKRTPLMEEGYIGRVMRAESDIKDKAQIKVNGDYWTVINKKGLIHAGEKFEITGIEGIKLEIEKVEEE